MKHAILVALLSSAACAQITILPSANFIPARPVIDFDGGLATPGTITGSEAYLVAGGILIASIVNDPGMHTPGDTLSSNVNGNALVSVNNTLSIAAPSAPMDNHTVGAGFGFVLDSVYTQFSYICVDQVNHDTVFETYLGGVLQNTATFGTAAFGFTAFPMTAFYIEDLGGFDEIRLKATSVGGWGCDSIQLGGNTGPPTYAVNSSDLSLDINGANATGFAPIRFEGSVNETFTLNIGGAPAPWDALVSLSEPVPDIGFAANNLVNIDPFGAGNFFLNNLRFSPINPLPTLSLPVALSAQRTSIQGVALNAANPDGFITSAAVTYLGRPCTGGTDFESGFPSDWINGSASSMNWTSNTGGTGSLNTGPTAAAGGANYLYAETSVTNPATFIFDTCAVDIGGLATFDLTFDLSRIGAEIGTLRVLVDDGTGTFPNVAATYTGPDPAQSQGGVEWSAETISLLPFLTSATLTVRFEYVSGTSFTGDLALDNVVLN